MTPLSTPAKVSWLQTSTRCIHVRLPPFSGGTAREKWSTMFSNHRVVQFAADGRGGGGSAGAAAASAADAADAATSATASANRAKEEGAITPNTAVGLQSPEPRQSSIASDPIAARHVPPISSQSDWPHSRL